MGLLEKFNKTMTETINFQEYLDSQNHKGLAEEFYNTREKVINEQELNDADRFHIAMLLKIEGDKWMKLHEETKV
ncbi:hypothetical protein ABN763_10075 [Spongiivirga sp. MCCC 1A20706]|uniref:hypothetical protein n=1 Tax=Spongiivirga sp. MCCC 1A20706 TaxID=3160963 RepID=UPI003977AE2B